MVPETVNVCRCIKIDFGLYLESDCVVGLRPAWVSDLAVVAQLPHVDVVNEGDVILRMPVQAVAVHRERDSVKKPAKDSC